MIVVYADLFSVNNNYERPTFSVYTEVFRYTGIY